MQIYRGLDIGTAKPSAAERARIPHHLIDLLDLHESCDAARYRAHALAARAEIEARGRRALFCGGTGLYFNALAFGVGEAPAPDPALRAELEARPIAELLEELQRADPATWARIDRQNPRRVVRALEIARSSGEAGTTLRRDWRTHPPAGIWLGLMRERADLTHRIDRRVEAMFEQGLVAETAALLERGLAGNRTAMQAIGYRQVVEHLLGVRDLPSTVALIQQKTRQYARRQMTWFTRQLPLRWIQAAPDEPTGSLVRKALALIEPIPA